MPKEIKQTVRAPNWMGSKGRLIWRLCDFVKSKKYGELTLQLISRFVVEDSVSVLVRNNTFKLTTGYPIINYRNSTFASKEPETLNWIDSFETSSVLWDVGANIGLYSLYAAKTRECRVFAFEPSVFCIEHLARNVWLNNLQHAITVVPNPLSSNTQPNLLKLSKREYGGAANAFGTNIGQDGTEIKVKFEYNVLGTTIDEAVSKLKLPVPQHIKIDVDGIEPLILAGGAQTLMQVESVSVEVPTYRGANERVSELLSQAGLKLVLDSGNQIWRRV
jgi:FkbM family methyltransferase